MSLHSGSERRAGPLIWINSPASDEKTVAARDALPIRRRHMEPGLEAAILPPWVGGLNFERGPDRSAQNE